MTFLAALLVATFGWRSATSVQTTQAGGAMDDVSRTLDAGSR